MLNDTNVAKKSFFDPAKKTKILIHGFSAGMYFAHRFINGKKNLHSTGKRAGFERGTMRCTV